MIDKLLTFLEAFTLDERKQQLREVVKQRTRYITVVLENIYQTQNANAVLRSCDCFGIQDVHIIENDNSFNINPQVVRGATKWLHLHRYNELANNTRSALKQLKKEGYRIVATSPHRNDVNLNDFDITKGKTAFVFGNEKRGISDIVLEEADEFMKIPMYGFSESLNISVSAAIILQHFANQLKTSAINWQLPEDDLKQLHFEWLKKSIKKSELLVDDFNKRNNTDF
jgi:tRNA (guanosine-2'-O-)-methyltransferase